VKTLLKSVHIYQSYCKKTLAQFFWPTLYTSHLIWSSLAWYEAVFTDSQIRVVYSMTRSSQLRRQDAARVGTNNLLLYVSTLYSNLSPHSLSMNNMVAFTQLSVMLFEIHRMSTCSLISLGYVNARAGVVRDRRAPDGLHRQFPRRLDGRSQHDVI